MILRFFPKPDSPYSQIFRKFGQKKAEPNSPHAYRQLRPVAMETQLVAASTSYGNIARATTPFVHLFKYYEVS
jgi:hypothetical protein